VAYNTKLAGRKPPSVLGSEPGEDAARQLSRIANAPSHNLRKKRTKPLAIEREKLRFGVGLRHEDCPKLHFCAPAVATEIATGIRTHTSDGRVEGFPEKIGTQITVYELGSSHQSVISFRRYVCGVRYAVAADRRLVRHSVPVAASHIKRRYDV
jgi:hypothetical protein